MAKTSILTILFQLAKKGNADQETITSLSKMKSAAATAGLAFGALATVGYGLNKVYQNTAKVFLDYATQVRDLSRVTGMSAEETSRLIQAGDDLGITYESLQKSLWAASKNGFDVNIDSLAALADQYVSLANPAERAELLAKNFGKSGAEMGKLLEQGSQGVKKFTAAVNDNMVLSDNAVRQAREYEMQLDNFNDQWTALKISAGKPIIARLLMIFQNTNNISFVRDQLGLTGNSAIQMTHALKVMNEQISSGNIGTAAEGYQKMAQAAEYAAQSQERNSDAIERAAQEAEKLADKQNMVMDVAFRLQDALSSYNDKMAEVNQTQQEAQAAWDQAQANYEKGLITQKDLTAAQETYNATMAETGATAEKAAAQHQEAMNRIIFSIIQAQAASDGLTEAESKGLLQIAVQLGMVDQSTADVANQMVDHFSDISDGVRDTNGALFKMNEEIYIARTNQGTYNYLFQIRTIGSIPNFSGLGKAARDAGIDEFGAGGSGGGGGGYADGGWLGGGWSVVGEKGYEFISPNGFVFTHEQSRALEAAGILPKLGFAAGGAIGATGMSAGSKVVGLRGASIREKINSAGTTSSTTTSAVVEASQQVAELAQENASASNQATKDVSNMAGDLMTSMQESNNSLLNEVQKLNDNIAGLQEATTRAIRENLQAVLT